MGINGLMAVGYLSTPAEDIRDTVLYSTGYSWLLVDSRHILLVLAILILKVQ